MPWSGSKLDFALRGHKKSAGSWDGYAAFALVLKMPLDASMQQANIIQVQASTWARQFPLQAKLTATCQLSYLQASSHGALLSARQLLIIRGLFFERYQPD